MHHLARGVLAGIASGLASHALAVPVLAVTSAFAMPTGFPLALWDAVVVFGLGAAAVAFCIHLAALWLSSARAFVALGLFAATVLIVGVATGHLAMDHKFMLALVVGALAASATHNRLRSNNSSKPTPLRGAA